MQQLLPAVWATDRLNSWVRSESHRQSYSSAKFAVYWLKKQALLAADAAGLCEHRKVRVRVKCRNCGGSGYYDPDTGRECYTCDTAGTVNLSFLETRIHGLYCWHTPFQNLFALSRPLWQRFTEERGELVTDWQPNQTGRDLTALEVVEAFNLAEALWPDGPEEYRLPVGRIFSGCRCCGEEPTVFIPVTRCALSWEVPFCQPCVDAHTWYVLKTRHSLESVPRELVNTPAVREWMLRHRVAM